MFKRKKKEEHIVPEDWVENISKEKLEEVNRKGELKTIRLIIEEKNKRRVPGLRRGKQLLSFGLLMVNIGLAVSSFGMWNWYFSLFFFLNSFSLLDHLNKLRRKNEQTWEPEET